MEICMHSDGVVWYLGIHIPVVAYQREALGIWWKPMYKEQVSVILDIGGNLNHFMSYCRLDACNEILFNIWDFCLSNNTIRLTFLQTVTLAYATNVLAVALSYLHVGGRTPTDLQYLDRRWMRDSMRIRRNLESLSFRLRSRCLRTATAYHLLTICLHRGPTEKGSKATFLINM